MGGCWPAAALMGRSGCGRCQTGRLLASSCRAYRRGRLGVALSTGRGLLASGGADGTVRLWEASSGRLLATLRATLGGLGRGARGRTAAGQRQQ